MHAHYSTSFADFSLANNAIIVTLPIKADFASGLVRPTRGGLTGLLNRPILSLSTGSTSARACCHSSSVGCHSSKLNAHRTFPLCPLMNSIGKEHGGMKVVYEKEIKYIPYVIIKGQE